MVTGIPDVSSDFKAKIQSFPNPFNPQTTVVYTVPHQGLVTISIYDAQGKHVRNLVAKDTTPGEHVTTWNGRNHKGAQVTSGVYFVRMTVGDQMASDKLVLLK